MSVESFAWILFTFLRCTSLDHAKEEFKAYRDASGIECSGSLYVYDDESWALALEFAGVGNPFDYPDKVIESGPNGGIRVNAA